METIRSFQDLIDHQSQPQLVRLDNKPKKQSAWLISRDGAPDYVIDCHRCNTPAKLVGWIHYLLGEPWANQEHIKQLIDRVVQRYPACRTFA